MLIFHPENFTSDGTACQGAGALSDLVADSPVRITPKGKDPVWSKLTGGSITQDGNCRLKFSADIPEAESYRIEVGGRVPVDRARRTIEHPDRWWITLDWDAMSPIPVP